MAHTKQQIKRYKNANKKHVINKSYKSALKTATKKFVAEVEAGNKEAAQEAYRQVISKLDSSKTKGIHHRNYVNRKKSQLTKLMNSIN